MRCKIRGISLIEISVALSLTALLVSSYFALSARLVHAQTKQECRTRAVTLLQSEFVKFKESNPERWADSVERTQKVSSVLYHLNVSSDEERSDRERGFVVLQGQVTWQGSSGLKTIEREVWIHEKLN